MVALKLTIIFAMLLGLYTYAQSSAAQSVGGLSLSRMAVQLKRAGYIEIAEKNQSSDMQTEVFELHVPTRPHYHVNARLELTCRGDEIVNVRHDEFDAESPD